MKLFNISDIHGSTKPIDEAAPLIRAADWVVISGDLTRSKTRDEAAETTTPSNNIRPASLPSTATGTDWRKRLPRRNYTLSIGNEY
jgi:predicted phosphodiesterase